MKRGLTLGATLFAFVALAHVYRFDLLLPATVGNVVVDGGTFPLQWFDMQSPGPSATAQLYATREALSPFAAPDGSIFQISDELSIASPVDFYDWDTTDAGDGCWQPYALIRDPIEGLFLSKAEGRVTVQHGANVPPSLWVTTPATALPDDAGRLSLQWDVDEPDDDSVTRISWQAADGQTGVVAPRLPLARGTRSATYTLDAHRLPDQPVWLHLEMTSGDGGLTCDAWWRGFVTGLAPPDAGPADLDAGPLDAGNNPGEMPRGCGCNAASLQLFGAMSIWLRVVRRGNRANEGSR